MNKQTYETPRMTVYGDVRTTTQTSDGPTGDSLVSTQGQDSLGTVAAPFRAEK